MSLPFTREDLLQAISGVAYVVDRDGIILGFSRGPFLPERGGLSSPQHYDHAIGTSLFSIVQGDEVRNGYRVLHQAVCSGGGEALGFTYRCDAPDIERRMYMSLSRIAHASATTAVLYQSIVISETPRPSMPLFAFEARGTGRSVAADRIVSLCSYCQRVAAPVAEAAAEEEWIEAVEFYRRGGRSDVFVSHGICDACFVRIVEPALITMK